MPGKVVFVFDPEGYDVYIGRGRDPRTNQYPPTNYGNRYSHKENTMAMFKTDTVEEAVLRNKEDILKDPELVAKIKRELKGKRLGCWCKTKKNPDAPCHGDTLVEIANS